MKRFILFTAILLTTGLGLLAISCVHHYGATSPGPITNPPNTPTSTPTTTTSGTPTNTPTVTATGTPTLPPDVISTFEDGTTLVNPTLTGVTTGDWADATYGGPAATPNMINNPFVVSNAVPDSADSSDFAAHIGWPGAPVTCIAVGGYEADQLTCNLGNSAASIYYDASPFTGIAFYYNIAADDTTTYRQFQVATVNTVSSFNHFHYLLPNGSSGGWKAVTLTWSQVVYPGFGPNSGLLTTTGPTTVAGTGYPGNLTHIAYLQWNWSDNLAGSTGAPVTTFADFWVDNVKFIP